MQELHIILFLDEEVLTKLPTHLLQSTHRILMCIASLECS